MPSGSRSAATAGFRFGAIRNPSRLVLLRLRRRWGFQFSTSDQLLAQLSREMMAFSQRKNFDLVYYSVTCALIFVSFINVGHVSIY